jgi:hypothetical protein
MPMMHNGIRVMQLKDTGGMSYMGLNGTALNGVVCRIARSGNNDAQLKAEGWPVK